MRFSKASLVVAALAIAAPCALVATSINSEYRTSGDETITNLNGSGVIIVTGGTLTLNVTQATTFNGVILDNSTFTGGAYDYTRSEGSNLTITGGGTLQYDGFRHFTSDLGLDQFDVTGSGTDPRYDPNYIKGYYRNHSSQIRYSADLGAYSVLSSGRQIESIYTTTEGTIGAISGTILIENGELIVSGYINQWVDYSAISDFAGVLASDYRSWGIMTDTSSPNFSDWFIYGEMKGASNTVLQGSSTLNFQNTNQNVVNAAINIGNQYDNGAFTPLSKRLNFVYNLQTGTQNADGTYTNDQLHTQLAVGQNEDGKSEYRIFVHMEAGVDGSIGIIQGNEGGRFYKSGAGDFKILNNSTFKGDVFLAGGTTTLGDVSNGILSSVNSINLVGSNGIQGKYIAGDYLGYTLNNIPYYEFRGSYAPTQELTELAVLEITNDQQINNLQALFSEDAAATDMNKTVTSAVENAAKTTSADEPFVASTGKGTDLLIRDNTLTINQEQNGYYEGSINKGILDEGITTPQGTVVKKGAGTLALLLEVGMFKDLIIEEGNLIANSQALGWGTVTANSDGMLTIVQNTTGTLHATIIGGAESMLFITSYDYITNLGGNEIRVGTNATGVLEVAQSQEDFYGTVVVSDGVVVQIGSTRDEDGNIVPNSDVFKNVAAFVLTSGDSGIGSGLNLNNTDQTIHNFSGDSLSRINLGTGTLTLIQDETTSYSGIISGVGSLVKDGVGNFTLAGTSKDNVLHTGVTTVAAGTLTLANENILKNSSGLVIASGATVESSGLDQHLGALIGGTDATLNMGSGNLTIGLDADNRTAMANRKITEGAAFPSANFLATATSDISQITDTEAYLDGLGVFTGDDAGITDSANEKYYLSYAGKIVGSGTLTKIGTETLKLSGASDGFTGQVVISEGVLWINHDSLSSVPSILIDPGSAAASTTGEAQLAVFVDVGETASFATPTSGAGDFYKVGGGDLYLSKYSYIGDTVVQNGRLILENSAEEFSFSDIVVTAPGTLVVDQAADTTATFTGSITGDGNFEKDGEGKLILSGANSISYTGTTNVIAGELEMWALPQGDINIETAGTLTAFLDAQTTGDVALSSALTGTGTFNKTGDSTLAINSPVTFAGVVNLVEGGVSLGAADVLENAIVHLEDDSTLLFNDNNQTFVGISGTADSLIDMGSGNLTFNVSTNDRVYEGEIKGTGDIIMNAVPVTAAQDCMLTLTGDNPDFTGNVLINSGVFQVKIPAIENATSLTVGTGTNYAELRFKADAGESVSLDAAITGTGIIGKSGKGTVHLDGIAALASSGGIRVEEGRLIVDDVRVGSVMPDVAVKKGATFQLNMSQNYIYTGEISGTLGGDTIFADSGNFAVSGAHTLTLGVELAYGGLTELLDGATLKFANGVDTINGLAGDEGTVVDAGNLETLTIAQNATGYFGGTITGGVDLVVTGTELFAYTGPDGTGNFDGAPNAIARITVGDATRADQGKLQVGIENEREIYLVNGGTLFVEVTAANSGKDYEAVINGDTGHLFKTGDGVWTLDKDSAVFQHNATIGTLGVVAGTLKLELDAGMLDVTDFAVGTSVDKDGVEHVGILQLNIENGTLDFNKVIQDAQEKIFDITGDGIVEKTGAGTLTFSEQTTGFTGTLRISEGTLDGSFTTSASIENNATLSPGVDVTDTTTVTTNGDFTQGATGILEIGIDGKNHDKVLYAGTATLGGTVHVTTVGAEPVRGATYLILSKTDGTVDTTQTITATVTTDDTADVNARYLLVGPGVGVGTVYEQLGEKGAAIFVAQKDLNKVSGAGIHDGLSNFIDVLNTAADFADPTYSPTANELDAYNIGAILNTASTGQLGQIINNFSPLGYSSLVAMPAAVANASVEHLHARLEQRRYDRASYTDKSWQAYVTATSNFVDNDDGTGDAVYNFNTYGAIVGTDCQISDGNLIGGALEYTNGKSTLHNGGGKITMNAVKGTAYLSHMVNNWFFVDVGVTAGYLDYDAKRDTATGRNKASPDGWSIGTFATIGTIFPITKTLHLNPYAGIEFNHYDISSFTESGSASRLKVDGFDYDSLRARVGTGIAWFFETGDWDWKFNLDVGYAHEILDTDTDMVASSASADPNGRLKFKVTSKTLASDVFQIGPSITLSLSEAMSVYASYRLEIGFDGETYNNINVGFRTRF